MRLDTKSRQDRSILAVFSWPRSLGTVGSCLCRENPIQDQNGSCHVTLSGVYPVKLHVLPKPFRSAYHVLAKTF